MALQKETESANRSIGEHLRRIMPEALKRDMEVEIRLGHIFDKYTGDRMSIETAHPCVITSSESLYFVASVDQSDYCKIVEHFRKKIGEPESRKIVDTFMNGCRRSDVKEIDGKTASEKPVIIKKTKVKTVDIYCPENQYDLRVSLSIEAVKEDTGIHSGGFSVREKDRKTFRCPKYVIDATKVSSIKQQSEPQVTYEVEIEVNNSDYIREEFSDLVVELADTIKKVL